MAVSETSLRVLGPLNPSSYQRHALHDEQRAWPESNCYVDLWIEVLHSLGLDPHACLGFTFGIDFEGDQWTFFKPSLADLQRLYGIDVQELSMWRPLAEHIAEQVGRGRLVLPEADAFFLPDTYGTDYHTNHSKTTIAVQEIDLSNRRLGYFHNGGYHSLSGADFEGLLRLKAKSSADILPPYVEFAKLDALQKRPAPELVALSVELTRGHLTRLPRENPVLRFEARFREHLSWLQQEGGGAFHAFAFATLRQLGACFELAGSFVCWLTARGETGIDQAALDCEAIANAAKALLLKTARSAATKKPFDPAWLLQGMATSWTSATDCLRARYGSR